jgi:hypothetical protein
VQLVIISVTVFIIFLKPLYFIYFFMTILVFMVILPIGIIAFDLIVGLDSLLD